MMDARLSERRQLQRLGSKITQVALEQMPTSKVTEHDGTNCSICLEACTGLVKTLPCQHRFHEQCIAQWLAAHNTCPDCRRQAGRSHYEHLLNGCQEHPPVPYSSTWDALRRGMPFRAWKMFFPGVQLFFFIPMLNLVGYKWLRLQIFGPDSCVPWVLWILGILWWFLDRAALITAKREYLAGRGGPPPVYWLRQYGEDGISFEHQV